jgi:hypothetical protein
MNTIVLALRFAARLFIVIQIVLGLLIWFGDTSLVQVHIVIGGLFVVALWAISLVALFALPSRTLPLFALFLGGAILWFGVAQRQLLVGSAHWAVRLLHLLLGVSAMGLIEPMSKAVLAQRQSS